ncbi:methyl-accepting chemotaxis protein [Methanocalculus chunghsingensis]|uniref:methyl-accepting chemotaxis protein n=1 Tax=Methanocalculus chunghsingensis TaxID=156457 RepID=UPI001B8B2634|nr:methyl-accepting chemotaxis protein [Methanocalculus chunghsingensis]
MTTADDLTLYKLILDATHDWEFLLGSDGTFTYVSPSCERISGYTPADFQRDAGLFKRIIHQKDLEKVEKALAVRDRDSRYVTFRIRHKKGTERWIGIFCTFVKDQHGHSQGVRGSCRDITDDISREKKQGAFLGAEFTRTAENLKKIAEGRTDFNLTPTKSDQDSDKAAEIFSRIDSALIEVQKSLKMLKADTDTIIDAVIGGKLSTRADTSRHTGEFREIIEGMNHILDAVTIRVNEAMRICGSYAVANFGATFDTSIRTEGDWADFKASLDRMGRAFNGLVREVNRVTGAFADGDFSVTVNPQLNVRGEFVTIKESLNKVSANVSTLVQQSIQLMEELAGAANEADASLDEVANGTQQIAASTGRVSGNIEKATHSAQQVLRAMEDLSAAVEEVTSSAESVAAISRTADEKSKDGAKIAARAEAGMGEINTATAEIDVIIKDINTQMNQIGKIVGVISDLAHQTNLLALNAAIEAARAGDAGRGFAVVASEVKALAQESRNSAENITEMIGNLRTGAERASSAMKNATLVVKDGSDQMQQTIAAFNDIVSSVESISRNIEEVASAAEEQAATVEEITASIHEMTDLMEKTGHEAGDTAAATEEVSASVDEVNQMVTRVSRFAEETLEANRKFRTA